MNIRVGTGFDVHRFAQGRKLIIGGVEIPHHQGLQGHSDADVLIHAIMDALLGAAGLRDIGHYFPDNDAEFKDADSRLLLEKVLQLLESEGWAIGNIDATVCLQKPKIAGYIPEMVQVLSRILNLDSGQLSIKATTTERLGFVGREEGAAAQAVALIQKKSA
jgi:2-C-methyl-D-erythritol 2,4-cyclodiphosphate synthase